MVGGGKMESNYSGVEKLLNGSGNAEWDSYVRMRKNVYKPLVSTHLDSNLVSEANWVLRSQCRCGEDLGIQARPGDVVYMDFGQAYLNEAGYQHFGIIISMCRHKALVIPMTSNPVQYRSAYDEKENPGGRTHLMRLGQLPGMAKPSVLFLNDMKYVNTARIIDIKAHLDTDSALFAKIRRRMLAIMFSTNMVR